MGLNNNPSQPAYLIPGLPSAMGANVLVGTDANGNLIASTPSQLRVVTVADATSVTINADTTDVAYQANTQIAGTLTINAPTGTITDGQKLIFRLSSTNVQNFSWNGIFVGSTDVPLPVSSTGSSRYDYMAFMYNAAASKWNIVARTFSYA